MQLLQTRRMLANISAYTVLLTMSLKCLQLVQVLHRVRFDCKYIEFHFKPITCFSLCENTLGMIYFLLILKAQLLITLNLNYCTKHYVNAKYVTNAVSDAWYFSVPSTCCWLKNTTSPNAAIPVLLNIKCFYRYTQVWFVQKPNSCTVKFLLTVVNHDILQRNLRKILDRTRRPLQ